MAESLVVPVTGLWPYTKFGNINLCWVNRNIARMFLPRNMLRDELYEWMINFPRLPLGMRADLKILSITLAAMIRLLGSMCLTELNQKQSLMLVSSKRHDGSNLVSCGRHFSR